MCIFGESSALAAAAPVVARRQLVTAARRRTGGDPSPEAHPELILRSDPPLMIRI